MYSINGLWQLANKDSKQHPVYSEITCEFKELIDHVRGHFSHEEELMEKIDFPALVIHINAHNDFLKKLNDAYEDFVETKDVDKIKSFISTSLKGEFLDHIIALDSITSDYSLLLKSNSQ